MSRADLQKRAEAAFISSFGSSSTTSVHAPGRVNLIGEHTDYNDGFVLPCAIDRGTVIAVRRRTDRRVRVVALDYGGARDEFDLTQPLTPEGAVHWSHYVRGMAEQLVSFDPSLPGLDMVITGDVPQGAGLSSSASLEVAVGAAFRAAGGAPNLDPTQLALLAQRAENEFVGCQCGIMDQLVSARGVAGSALLIDCRNLSTMPVALPEDAAVLIAHSMVRRGLVDSHYNERREACAAAARHLGVNALRDVTLDQLETSGLPALTRRRARHVVTENSRTLRAAEVLALGDLAAMAALMAASHASMRNDFEITVPAVDRLVELITDTLAGEGGCRMTGGGFGGCVVAVMPRRRVAAVESAINLHYRSPEGLASKVFVCQPSAGAGAYIPGRIRCKHLAISLLTDDSIRSISNEHVRPQHMTQTTSSALPRSAIWAFGLVAMPLSTIGLPLTIYLAPFYAGEMGLSLAALGTAMLIARFADICIDPFIGAFSDRLRGRFGRRKPFLVVGSIVLLLGMSQLFNPGKGVTMVYFLGWLAVMYAGFSLIQVPHRAWGAELSPYYDERTRISSVRQFFSTGGLIVSTLVPAVVLGQAGAKSSDVLFALTIMTLIALPIVAGINLYFTPEPPPTPRPPRARFDWKANWRALRRNGPLQCILLVVFIGFSAETFRQTLTVFFARDVIGVKNLGLVYVYYFISAFCGVPCWRWLAKRTSKHQALAAGMVIAICTNLGLFLLGKGDTALFTAMFILKGFCFGALDLLPAAMLADAADVDSAITRKSRNGLLFAVFGVVTNLGQAVGQGASLNALSWVGYRAAGETDPSALASLSLLYAVVPSLALGLAMFIALRYSLTANRHERLRVLLQERKAPASA